MIGPQVCICCIKGKQNYRLQYRFVREYRCFCLMPWKPNKRNNFTVHPLELYHLKWARIQQLIVPAATGSEKILSIVFALAKMYRCGYYSIQIAVLTNSGLSNCIKLLVGTNITCLLGLKARCQNAQCEHRTFLIGGAGTFLGHF